MVGVWPGTMVLGISKIPSKSVSFQARRATSRNTLYLRCCTLVSNFLDFFSMGNSSYAYAVIR